MFLLIFCTTKSLRNLPKKYNQKCHPRGKSPAIWAVHNFALSLHIFHIYHRYWFTSHRKDGSSLTDSLVSLSEELQFLIISGGNHIIYKVQILALINQSFNFSLKKTHQVLNICLNCTKKTLFFFMLAPKRLISTSKDYELTV